MRAGYKLGLNMLAQYMVVLIGALVFLIPAAGTTWLLVALNVALLAGYGLLLYSAGCQRGEKACSIDATVQSQISGGHAVDPSLREQGFDRKVALIGYGVGVLPLLVVALVNLLAKPVWIGPAEEPANLLHVIARFVFMPYVGVSMLLDNNADILNPLFLAFALVLPVLEPVGYLQGPRLYQKTLKMIELGRKRKMRNLRVNRKPRQPKPPKMEV